MGDYIPNKIRCKNCKWFEKTGDKHVGLCKNPRQTYGGRYSIVIRPNWPGGYFENCFEEKDQ